MCLTTIATMHGPLLFACSILNTEFGFDKQVQTLYMPLMLTEPGLRKPSNVIS